MTPIQAIHRRDRWADWAVIALVALALIGGVVLRELTLSRATPFATGADVTAKCPAGWVHETGDDPLFAARDPRGGAFDTTLELRSRPLAEEAELSLALDGLGLERARNVIAYQNLTTDQVVTDGQTAVRRTFSYVHQNRNPYLDQLPVVIKGTDLALRDGGRVVIVTYLASTDHFDEDGRYFRAFVESLDF